MGFGQLTPSGIEKHFELGKWLKKRYSEWLPEVYSAEDVHSGIEKHFELGKWLKKRYSEWLPEVYSAEDVHVRSSDYDRTIMSA
ncbi:hypothetical protein ACI65C_010467 [Semiaphis heraclei]